MTPFAIFAIVLTFVYIIYYGFAISRDLTRKAIQEETNEESIEVDVFVQREKPEIVKSVGDGFQVGDRQVYQPEPLPDVICLDGDGKTKAQGIDAVLDCEHLYHKAGETKESCENIHAEYELEYTSEEYEAMIKRKYGFSLDEPSDESIPPIFMDKV